MALTTPALAAKAALLALNFVIVDFGQCLFLQTPADRGGFCYLAGYKSDDMWTGLSAAYVSGLPQAQAILADQANRLALGNPLLSSAFARPGSRQAG